MKRSALIRISLGACATAVAVTVACLALAIPGARAICAEVEYTGAADGSWATAANWTGGKLPTKSQSVCIPAGEGTIEVPSGFNAEAKTLSAQSGVKIASTGTLAIAETLIGAGTASTFSGLEIEAGGHLSTAGGWIFLAGGVVLEGEISTSKPTEALVRLLSGTLAGNGTIAVQFNNQAGTLEPGGAGIVGELHLTMASSQSPAGTLVLDLASGSSFDRLSDTTSNFFAEGTLDINLLGGYTPTVATKWEFMSGGPGTSMEFEAFSPVSFTARSVPNGAEVELLPEPPTAVTEPATAVIQTSAKLNGTVNPNKENVTACEFKYGTTTTYGSTVACSAIASAGSSPVAVDAAITGLTARTTYHFKIVAKNLIGTDEGDDRTFTTAAAPTGETKEPAPEKEPPSEPPTTGTTSTTTTGSGSGSLVSNITGAGMTAPAPAVATTPKAVEELLLGCGKRPLVLNDVLIRGGHVVLNGSAAKSLVGKSVKIVFDSGKPVATATVQANGQFSTTAPLPPARLRDSNSARYIAQSGDQRSLNLKLTRRLSLEPPKSSHGSVTLVGQVVPPLSKPIAPVSVEQQLECGKTSKVLTFTPSASGRFHVTIAGIPANAKAAIYRLTSTVAQSRGAAKHGFATFSLPLPVRLG